MTVQWEPQQAQLNPGIAARIMTSATTSKWADPMMCQLVCAGSKVYFHDGI